MRKEVAKDRNCVVMYPYAFFQNFGEVESFQNHFLLEKQILENAKDCNLLGRISAHIKDCLILLCKDSPSCPWSYEAS